MKRSAVKCLSVVVQVMCCAVLLLTTVVSAMPSAGLSAGKSFITIDQVQETEGKRFIITGSYDGVYNVVLSVAGRETVGTQMIPTLGPHAGTWTATWDASAYDGDMEIVARGNDAATRYGVWSPFITVSVDNPPLSKPKVRVTGPADGEVVSGQVKVRVSVDSKNPVASVEVRVTGQPWQTAQQTDGGYEFHWNPPNDERLVYAIQARATDSVGNIGMSLTTYVKTESEEEDNGAEEEHAVLPRQDRAMWIWEPSSYTLLLNPGSRDVLEQFANDTTTFPSQPVTTLYYATGKYAGMEMLEDESAQVEEFVEWSHEQGFQVHALIAGGTSPPYIAVYPQYHDDAVREIESVINYNLAADEAARFDGVNIDIEPYILPDFADRAPFLQQQYLMLMDKMKSRVDVSKTKIAFGPAIPRWYDTNVNTKAVEWKGTVKPLSEHIQDISDYISIMDYRDTASGSAGIIAGAQNELDYAESIGKVNSVVIGVETLDVASSGDPETITFREEGRVAMEAELALVYDAFAAYSSFAGVAVHHYDSYRELPSDWSRNRYAWNPPPDSEPPTQPGNLQAEELDYEQITLRYDRASDNQEVSGYLIYRGTEAGFIPDPDGYEAQVRGLSYKDVGLLPNTTYCYRVAAVDLAGNVGPMSGESCATTGATDLKPMVIGSMAAAVNNGKVKVTLQVVDAETNVPVTAAVYGRFEFASGKYQQGATDAAGFYTATSEALAPGLLVGFKPDRIAAASYYWAQAHDRPHSVRIYTDETTSGSPLR
ncbi:Ig-like domain-containing protein [Paenibacillus sp. OSY-SE]|uniref:Ig-like domain-containing protein n=1 Tax=Paenibacillus sp. OSY-SE TaxID=1196323 RepID=UPI0012FACD77|nr:Ig-like domain-containing protein [Paenibacillus sp. OSY-SE]